MEVRIGGGDAVGEQHAVEDRRRRVRLALGVELRQPRLRLALGRHRQGSITVARVVATASGSGSGLAGGRRRAPSRPRRGVAPTVASTTTRSGSPPAPTRSR